MTEPVLVVVVNYGVVDHVERLMASGALLGQRVLLVDNDSQPQRLQAVARAHEAEVLLLDRNHGFAGAVNRALAHAGDHGPVLLLNPDVRLKASDVLALRRALAHGRLTGVTPLLLNRDGSVQVGTAGGPATLAGFVAYFLFVSHLVPAVGGVCHTRRQLLSGRAPAWACMACLMLDAQAFRRYGPIPEHELVYAEDVAWGWAASRRGACFAVLRDVCVVHEQGAAGASPRWRHALTRLAVRENGPARGRMASGAMVLGLAIRRLIGRRIA